MFTGLIESIGVLSEVRRRAQNVDLVVRPDRQDLIGAVGSSVAVDGACLTVTASHPGELVFTAVRETIGRTTLGSATPGRRVNLERALRMGDRLEGHLVLGHIDGIGRVVRDRDEGGSVRRVIAVPADLAGLLAEKGSVAIDGISLTIAEVRASEIAVAVIPHTWRSTTMALKRPGDSVNLECDVIARYLRRLLATRGASRPGVSGPGGTLGPWFEEREGTEW